MASNGSKLKQNDKQQKADAMGPSQQPPINVINNSLNITIYNNGDNGQNGGVQTS
jgi:hypothetical protein